MRLLTTIKAALFSRCVLARQFTSVLTAGWFLFFMLATASMMGGVASAATEPETTLTNVVKVSFTVGGGASIQKQASVSLVTSKRTPAKVTFHSIFSGATEVKIPTTQYSVGNANGDIWQPVKTDVSGATPIIETFSFSSDEPLIVRLEDFDQNLDPNQSESVIVHLQIGNTGDNETLKLTETEPSSGVFIGSINLKNSAAASGYDGQLSVVALSQITAAYTDLMDKTDSVATLGIIEPSNLVFDSTTGEPVSGAEITLINQVSGENARVVIGDEALAWPSTVISGESVNLSESSRSVEMGKGEFRFPRVFEGEYYLKVVPPKGYRFPSQQSQAQLLKLGGIANQVMTGSRGEVFRIDHALGAVLLNIPLDPFEGRFSVAKTVNVDTASMGDELEYRVSLHNNDASYRLNNVYLVDTLPPGFRYIEGSAEFSDHSKIPSTNVRVDGRRLEIDYGSLLPNATDTLSYRVMVGAGSPLNEAINRVQGFSDGVTSNIATASVTLHDELMRQKNILIGRVYSGPCDKPEEQRPVKSARLYLNNGRTVLTDEQGRWHLEGLSAGSYVIQLDEASLPQAVIAAPCKMTSQHLGKRYARMLQLNKGQIWRADFHVDLDSEAALPTTRKKLKKPIQSLPDKPLQAFDADFASSTQPGFEFLWPPARHVPSISTLKVAVKYPPKKRLKLLLNGKEVSPMNLEGKASNKAKTVGISRWTGVDITQKNNTLTAVLSDKSGKELKRITRHVHFTESSSKAMLVEAESVLVANGQNQPVIAIRLEDDDGFTPRPRTHGFFSLQSDQWIVLDIESSEQADRLALNKSQQGKYRYTVSDDGLVRITLEPTTRSGMVTINVHLSNGKTGAIRAWLQPALRDWIMVGYAKGTLGYQTLSGHSDTLSDLGEEAGFYQKGRISFFAKGRIRGKYLLTLAYDSDKPDTDVGEQLTGIIDPDAWYTLYGDEQAQQYDAASSSSLYVKLEREQFYALFGDYHTDLDITELGRYERTLHGLKASHEGKKIQYSAFMSQTSQQSQRDDIRGDGTSGLYFLSRSAISNSEAIRIETRDRDHPEVVLDSRSLSRHLDYDIDYQAGSVFFKFPISGTDDEFNPMYIVAEYESEDDEGEKELVVGGRVGYASEDQRIKLGATYLRESSEDQLVSMDAELKINDSVRLKSELATSKSTVKAQAMLAELEYRKDKIQAKLYAHQQDPGFGLGQQSGVLEGKRKMGASAKYQLTANEAFLMEASRQLDLETDGKQSRAAIEWQKRSQNQKFTIGLNQVSEETETDSTQLQTLTLGASRLLNGGRLSVSTVLDKSLSATDKNTKNDRLKLGADYKLSDKTSLFVEQQWVRHEQDSSQQTRVGLKSKVWDGGNVRTDLVRETEQGDASFNKDYFLLGLSQHWKLNEHLHLDLSFDKTKTLNLQQSLSLGLHSDDTTSANGDYYAVSLGAGWNKKRWSAASRLEYRDSDTETRHSLQLKAIRKKGDRWAVSQQAKLMDTQNDNGDSDREFTFSVGLAIRDKDLQYTLFNQLDWVDKKSVTGEDVNRSRKLINNLHVNRQLNENAELSLHHGVKFVKSESASGDWSMTNTLQGALRYDIGNRWDAGIQGGVLLHSNTATQSAYAGVSLGFTPTENTRVEIGYNVEGFDDADFSSAQYTKSGPYLNLNYLLDQSLLKKLNKNN